MFQSLVSAFLAAYLTDRIFLHDGFLMEEFLDFPRFTSTNYSQIFHLFGSRHVFLNSQYFMYTGVQDMMLCDDLSSRFSEQFVFLESDQYFAGLLINNDYYALELQRLFGDKMFGIISSFLFQLRPEIDREVTEFYEANLAGRRSVGIHVRTHTLGHPGKCASLAGGATSYGEDELIPAVMLVTDNPSIRQEAYRNLGDQLVIREGPITRSNLEGQVD
ncbi:hypothetical protein GUITHDRAFT_121192 [Guillardia theta CCMP2712]|uniref:GT23 domain-containing protein n=1 Tax=Guillardia theta (strain CCMP2712) TaxID=905079 RepID=L1I9V6_GUITC|nr:hypothetical protein GUITHDRAFT_121192 [Guillardia theta CCMP2712]EKX32635.1 hypothetical protein GUITHDRAFT_121192 [Guillardia theta CCMP2712]|eukprot:XP_005819615.1 hypothetical protein GUITHDRAFT_121192 [Guillardia theta CCMP2712]